MLIIWCACAGGHNVIGGLLDYLLERHPGSQLIGFKNGPGGILKKSFMDITEDIMVRLSALACQGVICESFCFVSCNQSTVPAWYPCNTGHCSVLDLMTELCIMFLPIADGIPQPGRLPPHWQWPRQDREGERPRAGYIRCERA